ncbi:MAG: alpha/beta fold hydrolase [Ideonella sp.]|nr:alpha/beta fold hydrolase [Ideonella sp.]MBL0150503.1 alpha/beta fold hydrolase [Ideonella sp.]
MPGLATTLLLLPGMASDAALWRHQWPVLQAHPGLDVRVVDAHARFATLPEMGAALLAENPGELLLAGTSMGGILALETWQQAPHRVKGLALLGTSARPDTPELIVLRTQACELFAAGRMDEVLRANLMFAFHADSLREQPGLAEAYLAMMGRAGPGQLIRQNRAIMARPDRRPMLPGMACPTLVVCGDSDQLTPPEASRELADGIPGAQLHLLPRCGHLLTWEQPGAVNRLLLEWLARALGG